MARLQERMVAHVRGVPRRSKIFMVESIGTAGDEQYFDTGEAESELSLGVLRLLCTFKYL